MDAARNLALDAINDVYEKGAYANVALAKRIREAEFESRDRRFATEIVYGTVKAGATIDWIIGKYASVPVKDMDFSVRNVLRMAVYQIKYMDKVPDSAACNEAVELAKTRVSVGAGKFVNAVLRSMLRAPEKSAFPTGSDSRTAEALALVEQHPEWLVRRWIKEFGYMEARELCRFDNASPPICLRANTIKNSRDELLALLKENSIEAHGSSLVSEGIILDSHRGLDSLKTLKRGLAQVQDESSMLVSHVLAPQKGETVIDACAAPGGKATHIAALMEDTGKVIACDIYDHKIKRIEENAKRLGIKSIEAVNLDARIIGEKYCGIADRVLVDAPCSGLGVLRRKPDSRWRKTPADLVKLPKLQLAILAGVADSLKKGGIMVYSTCTMEKQENQGVVEEFLKRRSDFELLNAGERLPVPRSDEMVQLYPQRDKTDGFFIACLRRK